MNQDKKTGKFVKGNKAQVKADPRVKCAKAATKTDIANYVRSLFDEDMGELEKRIKNKSKVKVFRHMLDRAVKDKDTNFIKWLIEMFIGKPKQILESEMNTAPAAFIIKPNGERIELGWKENAMTPVEDVK